VRVVSVAWMMGRDPDVMVEVYNTEGLMEAVLEALLEDPRAMAKALKMFREAR